MGLHICRCLRLSNFPRTSPSPPNSRSAPIHLRDATIPLSPISKLHRRAATQARGQLLCTAAAISTLADLKPDTVGHVRVTVALVNAFTPAGDVRPSGARGSTLVFVDLSGPLRVLLHWRQYAQFVDNFKREGHLVGQVCLSLLCFCRWMSSAD